MVPHVTLDQSYPALLFAVTGRRQITGFSYHPGLSGSLLLSDIHALARLRLRLLPEFLHLHRI